MTKQDIIQSVCERLDLPKPQAAQLVQATFDALMDSVIRDGRVELRNFGIFQIKRRQSRIGRNPKTGEKIRVAPRFIVNFKPGKEMELRLGELNSGVNAGNAIADVHSIYEEMDYASQDEDAGDAE